MQRMTNPVRVAIYTRKSVEDAEDKQFNSIDAQRQMCESFVAAKAAEGWVALSERFDDYGYSGGDLNRPAYRRLISQCEQGLIDKIIVFRIDRMTRSTKDFCEFDEKMKKLGIGFTSVSEPFVDTSSPMGELVVNLVENQSLVPDPGTANNVPRIFKLFLECKSVKKVAAQLQEEGIERFPGRPWTMQSVQNCLRNVRYVGDANSHGKIVKGRQPPLITRELWDKVNKILKEAATGPSRRASSPESELFQGLVYCGHCKHPMSYRWSRKDTLGVRKYSYFVCQQDLRKGISTCPVRHVSVTTVQDAVDQEIESIMLASTSMLVAAANTTTLTPEQIVAGLRRHTFWQGLSSANRRLIYRLFMRSITVYQSALELRMNLPVPGAADELEKAHYLPTNTLPDENIRIDDEGNLLVRIPVVFRTVSGRKQIVKAGDGAVTAKPTQRELDDALAQGPVLKSFAKALAWMKLIDEGKAASVSQLAELVGTDRRYVLYTIRLATLSPRIIRAALKGELPDGFSLQKVRKIETDDWEEQERLLGFPAVAQ